MAPFGDKMGSFLPKPSRPDFINPSFTAGYKNDKWVRFVIFTFCSSALLSASLPQRLRGTDSTPHIVACTDDGALPGCRSGVTWHVKTL
jgi:hypothetical protein